MSILLTQERVKELFNLDPETGILYWKVKTHRTKIGQVAGSRYGNGYWYIGFDGERHKRSRLVLLFCTGLLPSQVDHKNRNSVDDRPANLRAATQSQNNANSARVNRGLPKGVIFDARGLEKPFRARIRLKGKTRHLGWFPTPELAHKSYQIAAARLHGEFACFGKES